MPNHHCINESPSLCFWPWLFKEDQESHSYMIILLRLSSMIEEKSGSFDALEEVLKDVEDTLKLRDHQEVESFPNTHLLMFIWYLRSDY